MCTGDILTTQTDRNVSMNYVVRDFLLILISFRLIRVFFQIQEPRSQKNIVQRE